MQNLLTEHSPASRLPTWQPPKPGQPARAMVVLKSNFKITRLLSHLVILGLAFVFVVIGGLQLPERQLKAPHEIFSDNSDGSPAEVAEDTAALASSGRLVDRTGLVRSLPVPTISPPPQAEAVAAVPEIPEGIWTYEVQSGDTIIGIANRVGLAPETILWANPQLEDNPDLLWIGQQVTILPVDGVYHQVGGNDTVSTIAATLKVDPQAIIDFELNGLDPENPVIVPGQWLVVPNGIRPYVPKYVHATSVDAPAGSQAGSGSFQWPTSGQITQGFWGGHRALDIGAWQGAPIYAADGGYVVSAQWDDTGYGRTIVIDHGNGFKSLYAHLSVFYVSAGDEVTKGQQIGEMGSTGNSTGPHLHFELFQNSTKRNPWGFLP